MSVPSPRLLPYCVYSACVLAMMMSGRYQLTFPGTDASERTIAFEVREGETSTVNIDRNLGKPCLLRIRSNDTLRPRCALEATMKRMDAAQGVSFSIVGAHGTGTWELALDLLPGEYTISVRSQWGTETGNVFVVHDNQDDRQIVSFDIR